MPAPGLPGFPAGPPLALAPPSLPPYLPPRRPDRTTWLVVTLVALTAGLVGAWLGVALTDGGSARQASSVVVARPSDEVAGPTLDVGGIVAKVQPSVVNITVKTADGTGIGTGVILSADGEVVTNAHVVRDAEKVSVLLVGETQPRTAVVLASDVGNDLALLRIEGASGLPVAELANPGDVQVGDDVVALGFALDLDGGPSVTKGIVSALDRTLPIDDNVLDGLIQTDAAISSGNSGGPLVNSRGQVVGINTAVASSGADFQANGIGFAISLREAQPVLDEMRAGHGGGPLPFLGVKIDDRVDGGGGALITEVVADAPADQAGVAVGDVVVGVDGQSVQGAGGLIAAIRDAKPGDVLRLDIERNGAVQTIDVTLIERDDD